MSILKRLALPLVALAAITASTSAFAGYSAIAASKNGGSSFVSGYRSMDAARTAAVDQCRARHGGSCSSHVAEDDDWYFVAGMCDGEPYTAASQHNHDSAFAMLVAKAIVDNRSNCRITATR